MRRLAFASLVLALLLGGCSATPHHNAAHPAYGETEYKNDQAQCRTQNSRIVMSSGYDEKSEVQVDEAKARACMAERGWQTGDR